MENYHITITINRIEQSTEELRLITNKIKSGKQDFGDVTTKEILEKTINENLMLLNNQYKNFILNNTITDYEKLSTLYYIHIR